MKRSAKYDIIVLDDHSGHQHQFRISKKTIGILVTSLVFGTAALVASSFFLFKDAESNSNYAELHRQNQELLLANERYHSASVEMEQKLNLFNEMASKLALYVGIEPLDYYQEGIGGPDIFENELSRYLRYDLGLMQKKTELLEQRLDTLEEAFQTQTDILDSTPSLLPARGWISSGFQYRTDPFTGKKTWHNGVDISGEKGTPIFAPAKGVVVYKGYQGGFGNLLVLDHGNGIKTKFGHLDRFNVSKGKRVKRGDLIGYMGSTGRSTAPHLHYEIHRDDKSINPMKYIIRDIKAL